MGWKEGESLGKTGGGLLEPVSYCCSFLKLLNYKIFIQVQLSSNISGAGLGSTEVMSVTKTNEKTNIWAKTQERFQKLPESNRAFEDTSDQNIVIVVNYSERSKVYIKIIFVIILHFNINIK